VTGIGNDAAGGEGYSAESLTIPLTGTWTKYVIPIPVPSKYTSVTGLFHLAEGADGYTIWLSDIQYETLGAGEVGAPTGATANLPASLTVAVGATSQIAYQPNTVSFALPVLTNGGKLTNVGFLYYDLTSSDPTKATVSNLGLVTGVAAGSTNVTAALGSIAVTGQTAVTVTGGGGGPTAPTTLAATPTRAAGNVVSLYTSSGTYTNVAVATWATSWGDPNTVTDYAIGTPTVKKYVGMSFVGVDFAGFDATTFTHFHVDVWTPDAAQFGVKLVNDAGGAASEATVSFNGTTTPPITTGSWISLDIPLSSFTGMSFNNVNQLLWLDNVGGPERATFYIDNVYFWK
jgi:hypothetical protein